MADIIFVETKIDSQDGALQIAQALVERRPAPYGSSAGLQRRLPGGGARAARRLGVHASARGKWAIGGGG